MPIVSPQPLGLAGPRGAIINITYRYNNNACACAAMLGKYLLPFRQWGGGEALIPNFIPAQSPGKQKQRAERTQRLFFAWE